MQICINKKHMITGVDSSDSDHHYESLYVNHDPDDDYDSFDSDTESEHSFNKVNLVSLIIFIIISIIYNVIS